MPCMKGGTYQNANLLNHGVGDTLVSVGAPIDEGFGKQIGRPQLSRRSGGEHKVSHSHGRRSLVPNWEMPSPEPARLYPTEAIKCCRALKVFVDFERKRRACSRDVTR